MTLWEWLCFGVAYACLWLWIWTLEVDLRTLRRRVTALTALEADVNYLTNSLDSLWKAHRTLKARHDRRWKNWKHVKGDVVEVGGLQYTIHDDGGMSLMSEPDSNSALAREERDR